MWFQTWEQPSEEGEHILVYVTSGFESLLDELKNVPRERFLVYGYDRADQDGVLTYKPFSRDGFLNDLAGCQAVIATAGFTLISESLHLGKPYCALPMQGQFEQQLNAFQLQRLGPSPVPQLVCVGHGVQSLTPGASRPGPLSTRGDWHVGL